MKYKWLLAITISTTITTTAQNQNKEVYFLSQPSLTPDGQTVIFSYEGDLWKAGIKEGNAVRLTAMQGYETDARVSPDGKWIAFTGRQYGNPDVFIIPVNGGDVKQLTYFSGADNVCSWSWDSKTVYFTSSRSSGLSGYKVSINGGTAQPVFGHHFFLNDHNIFEHPTSGELFFNDTWESNNQAQRKRYKGPYNPDIQSYNPVTKKYKRYTDWPGKDFGATLDRKGNIYFISDETNGEYNLYTFGAGNKKTELTHFSSSIKNPVVNADGGKVVFEKDYQLWLYDVTDKKIEKLAVTIVRNNTLPQEKDFAVAGKISAFDISPDGKKMAFVSRGELFVSDIEGKFIRQMLRGSAERVKEVKWMSDNKTLLFNQTKDGYQNLYTMAADGKGDLKPITTHSQNDRSLIVNKKRTMAVYYSGRNEVCLLNLKTLESKTISRDEIWGFENSDPGFSPDDNYVVYTAFRNFEQDIFVYNIKENITVDLTNTDITETSPVWSPDGKYIYFISSRLQPSFPTGMKNPKIYRLPLQKLDAPYRMDKFDELFKEEKKDTTKKKDTIVTTIKIDTLNIMDRIEQVGPSSGSQYLVSVVQNADKTILLFISDHEGKNALYKTILDPFDNPKTEKIQGTEGDGIDIAVANDKYFVLLNGTIHKLNLDANKVDAVTTSFTFRRNLAAEFNQMFYEAWAQLEENYYDEKFHGVDWNKIKNHYRRFLPYLNNRSDLRVLLNDMLGELNSSHQGFSSSGAEEMVTLKNTTLETGIVFEDQDPYKVKYVLPRTAADKKEVALKEGDRLVKVNEEPVNPSIDRYYYFTKPSLDNELKLTFKRADQDITVKVHPQPSVIDNLYDKWIDDNQKRVDDKSHKRIAYSCMKNMGQHELEHFLIDMTKELDHREGLILDLRYNTGGNVHDEVLRFLSQRSYLQWKYREGRLARQSNFTPADKPIILLTNEQSLSDAEVTSAGFKALKLGKIVGNETYHWIIFTSGAGLVDGSFVRLPAWGCYTLDGKDLEWNGVTPDIKVPDTFEDKINGRDPQLDTAIEEILRQLAVMPAHP